MRFTITRAPASSKDKLETWAKKASWETLLNKAGTTFKKLPDKDKEGLTEAKAIKLMLAQPSMIKRPVLELPGGKTAGRLQAGAVREGVRLGAGADRHREHRAGRLPHDALGGRAAQRIEKTVMTGGRHADQVGRPFGRGGEDRGHDVALARGDRRRFVRLRMVFQFGRPIADMQQAFFDLASMPAIRCAKPMMVLTAAAGAGSRSTGMSTRLRCTSPRD